MKNVAWPLWLCFFLALTLAARCSNYADVFVNGQIHFVDPDCYARMTRARMVYEQPGTVVRHHQFENFPEGTIPHTTAPMDYLIAALAWLLSPFSANALDLAGAIVSPLLGVLTTAFLAYWASELMTQNYRRVMLLLVSLSPILVHGTILGRPDHQSLLIFLMTAAIGAELAMARTASMRWGIIGGCAWGFGLWVSLYEPLILMATIFLTKLLFYRTSLLNRERWPGHAIFLAILAVAVLVEHWRFTRPDSTTLHYFPRWAESIGEMSPMWRSSGGGILRSLLFSWVGFGLLLAPLLLLARLRDAKRTILILALLAVTFAFTLAQVRWGYFFALMFAISLPWQLSLFKRRWLVVSLFILSLWPLLQEWDRRLFPDRKRAAELTARRVERTALRRVAEGLRGTETLPMLAPWWLSPALAYWSGQPAVAGSSHGSLPGVVDTARFYAALDWNEALPILEKRKVRIVIAPEPGTVVDASDRLLSRPLPARDERPVAEMLWIHPHSVPPSLRVVDANPVFKVFAVAQTQGAGGP